MEAADKKAFVRGLANRLITGVEICHSMGIPTPFHAAEDLRRDVETGRVNVIEQREAKNLGVSRQGVTAGYYTKDEKGREFIVLPSLQVTDPLTIVHEFGHAMRDRAHQLDPLHFQEQYDSEARATDEKYNNAMVELAMLATGWPREAVGRFESEQVFKGSEAISDLVSDLEKRGKKDVARKVDGLITKSFKARPMLSHEFIDGVLTHIERDYGKADSPHFTPDAPRVARSILDNELDVDPRNLKTLEGKLLISHSIIHHLFGDKAPAVSILNKEERSAIRTAAFKRLLESHGQLSHQPIDKAIDLLHRDPKTRKIAETFRAMREMHVPATFVKDFKLGREKAGERLRPEEPLSRARREFIPKAGHSFAEA
jgi:hypothetical protein